ncbi:unnamed protein product [Strongylus vulgaris]|uniref:Uncharacterized protein n=1 Tax=Strongylus vulgaris TaxID=40348 RepID=A0A3P7KC52_STRVU|nr:unnamed protein product [Strongylus vulgaris]
MKEEFKEIPQGPSRLSCFATTLKNEEGTRASSRQRISTTKRFYTNLFRSSTPVSNPLIPTREIQPRISPAGVAPQFRPATTPGPDHISADLLRAGRHRLHEILAEHLTSYL